MENLIPVTAAEIQCILVAAAKTQFVEMNFDRDVKRIFAAAIEIHSSKLNLEPLPNEPHIKLFICSTSCA